MKTITQIAQINHVSRTSIYNRMKEHPDFKTKHMTYKKGKWFVNSTGVKILSQHKKRVQPRHYNTQNLTKQDFIRRNHQLEKEVAELSAKLANDDRLAQSVNRLASQSEPNQKRLAGQKSEPQQEIEQEDPWTRKYRKGQKKLAKLKNEANKMKTEQWKKQHPVKNWLMQKWLREMKK